MVNMNMKLLLISCILAFMITFTYASAYSFLTIYNPFTGRLDYYAVYTTNDTLVATINLTDSKFNGLLGYGNLTLCAEGQILKTSSGVWTCSIDQSTAGSSANYWQAIGGWMFPNTTSGGDYDVNVTTLRIEGSLQGANIGLKSGNISDTPWYYTIANISGLEKCYIAGANLTTSPTFYWSGANITTSPTLWWNTANVSGLSKCYISASNVSGLEKAYISTLNISALGYYYSPANLTISPTFWWNIANVSGLEKCYISNANVTTTPTMYWHPANLTISPTFFWSYANLTVSPTAYWSQANITGLGAWKDFYYATGNITGTVWTTCSNGTFRDKINTTFTISAGHISLESVTYDGTLGYDNLTKCSDGQVLKMSGANWACGTDNTGAASGSNYWQVIGGWMQPNTTSGGDVDVNMSTLKVDGAITGPNFAIKSGNISDTPWYYTTANVSGLEKCYIAGANVTTSPTLYWHTANISGLEKCYIAGANLTTSPTFYWSGANITTSPTLWWNTANVSGLEKCYINTGNISALGYYYSPANLTISPTFYWSGANITTSPTLYWHTANISGLSKCYISTLNISALGYYYSPANITSTPTMYWAGANLTTSPVFYWNQANITGLGAWKDFYYASANLTAPVWTIASNGTFVHKTGDSMTGSLNITNQNITAKGVPNGLMGSNGTCTIIYGPTSRLEIC